MKWIDGLKSSSKVALNTLINRAADTLNGIGTLACVVGGAGYTLSNYMQESVKAGYYGSVAVNGTVNLDVVAVEWDYGFNESMPFAKTLIDTSDGHSFKPTDYLSPTTVLWISTIVIASGTTFRLAGANLKKWQKGREEVSDYATKHQLVINGPTAKEFLYVSARSLLNSITITSFSFLISKKLLDVLLTYLDHQSLTYPFHGNNTIITTYYQGPTGMQEFPLDFFVSRETNVTIPRIDICLLVDERVNATAATNVTYGVGAFFDKLKDSRIGMEAGSAALITVTMGSVGFFSKKARELRDERVFPMARRGYSPIQV